MLQSSKVEECATERARSQVTPGQMLPSMPIGTSSAVIEPTRHLDRYPIRDVPSPGSLSFRLASRKLFAPTHPRGLSADLNGPARRPICPEMRPQSRPGNSTLRLCAAHSESDG
jgi:hypothetical protein